MSRRCLIGSNDLWTKMLDWLAAGELDNRPVYDGHGRRAGGLLFQGPGIGLSRYPVQHPARVRFLGAALKRVAGERRVSALVGNDLRNWHRNVSKPAAPGKRPRDRLAKAIVQMMRIVLSYGKAAGLGDCAKLYAMIEGMEFRKASDEKRIGKAKPKKKVAMTYAQAEAIVRKELEMGTRRGRSVALATAAQFEFTLSQIDASDIGSRPSIS
jgi:hypothetical protein